MSGEDVHVPRLNLLGTSMSALGYAILQAQTLIGQPITVIGGLAVMCRLSTPYRATSDLDIVNHRAGVENSQLELLVAHGAQLEGRSGAIVETPLGSVIVDVVEVSDADFSPLPDDPTGRLFVRSHAWAAATATPVMVSAQDQPDVKVAVAEVAPLIAMKLQATFDRGSAKEGTDLLDIVRLTLDRRSGPIARVQLSGVDAQLARDIGRHVAWCFDTHAKRSRALITAIPEGADIVLDDLHLVHELLTGALPGP